MGSPSGGHHHHCPPQAGPCCRRGTALSFRAEQIPHQTADKPEVVIAVSLLGSVSLQHEPCFIDQQNFGSILDSETINITYLAIGLKKIDDSFNEHSSHHPPPILLFVEVRIRALKK